jgi:hypothetical protein
LIEMHREIAEQGPAFLRLELDSDAAAAADFKPAEELDCDLVRRAVQSGLP